MRKILVNRLSGGGMPHHIAKRHEDMLRREPLIEAGRLPMHGGNGDKEEKRQIVICVQAE